MVPRLIHEILSKCAFCDGVGGGVGIGDSRSLIGGGDPNTGGGHEGGETSH